MTVGKAIRCVLPQSVDKGCFCELSANLPVWICWATINVGTYHVQQSPQQWSFDNRFVLRASASRYGSSVLPVSNQEFATPCCRSTLHRITFQKRVWLCSHWEGKRRFSKWIWQHRQQHWLLPLEWGLWEMIYRVKVLSLLNDKKQDRFHVETRANTSNGKLSGHLVPLLT